MSITSERLPFRLRSGAGFRGLLLAVIFGVSSAAVQAQFIRLGPFDFGATAKVDGIYTTNVDGVRPSATDQEMKDYYMVASFDLSSTVNLFRNSVMDLSTGVSVEKHARRDDLDTLSEPFGYGRMDTAFEFGRYTLRLNLAREVTAQTAEDTYVPSDVKKTRDVSTVTDYGAELEWKRNDLSILGGYSGSMTRHRDDQFKIDDRNDYKMYFDVDWQFSERLGFFYAYERQKAELLNSPGSYSDWDEKNNVGLKVEILERPHFTYTLGAEQSTVQGETVDWEPTHTLAIDDQLEFSKTLRLKGDVSYKYADKYAADEVALTCDVTLEQELTGTAAQSLTLTKHPAGTFGSTEKTDVTELEYLLRKNDLIIYDLNFTFTASYAHNVPMDHDLENENITKLEPKLSWDRNVSRKINRSLSYLYSWEHSNLISENLTEHRVTLSYSYTF